MSGEVSLTGGIQDWSIDHVQFFHPSDIPGASLADVHLGYNLDLAVLQSTAATSMTISVLVAPVPGPATAIVPILGLATGLRRRRR